jgi:alpha-L-rhamnosidase
MSRVAFLFFVVCSSVGLIGAAPVHLVDQAPVSIKRISREVVLVDFGQVAFGNLRLTPPDRATKPLKIHFGEALTGQRIHRKPSGSVRYATTMVDFKDSKESGIAAPPADKRNTETSGKGHPPWDALDGRKDLTGTVTLEV